MLCCVFVLFVLVCPMLTVSQSILDCHSVFSNVYVYIMIGRASQRRLSSRLRQFKRCNMSHTFDVKNLNQYTLISLESIDFRIRVISLLTEFINWAIVRKRQNFRSYLFQFMMILFVKFTKGIGHKFYQLMKSSPINTINLHSIMIILSMHAIHIEIYCK